MHRAEPSGDVVPRIHAAVDTVSPPRGTAPGSIERPWLAAAPTAPTWPDVATDLAAIDQRAGELDQRITQLLTLATQPSSG